jgi:hypothetical protein
MRHIIPIYDFLNEAAKEAFNPNYFDLQYVIPEDRFRDGLLKNISSRRGKSLTKRTISSDQATYPNKESFLEDVSISKIEASVYSTIDRVIKFIENNPLTGKTIKAKYLSNNSISEYLELGFDEDISLGTIETNLPFSTFDIRVDYDIYKNIPVFTFWADGDLFYYYTIFTLEQNDVIGSGEFHTYITADEFINSLFYETVWRAAISEIYETDDELFEKLGFSESMYEIASNYNYPSKITNNYFNKKFVKLLKTWISSGNLVSTDGKQPVFDAYTTIPSSALMSIPGEFGKLVKTQLGPTQNNYTIRLLPIDQKKYLALKFIFDNNYILSIESANYSTGFDWDSIIWKPLSQNEVNRLYFIDDNTGKPIHIQKFIKP